MASVGLAGPLARPAAALAAGATLPLAGLPSGVCALRLLARGGPGIRRLVLE